MAAWRLTTIDKVVSREKLFLATAGVTCIICATPVLRPNRRRKNQGKGAAMMRIEAVRGLGANMWFNEATTEAGRDALG